MLRGAGPPGRILGFALPFLGAAVFNAVGAIRNPGMYMTGFAPHAIGRFREFIERVVALAPDAFVLAIAVGQFLIAVALAVGRGVVLRLGVVGAVTFLAAISWLGVGGGVPDEPRPSDRVGVLWQPGAPSRTPKRAL